MKFPIEFKECPICGETDTLCRQAMADEPALSQSGALPIDIKVTALQNFTTISTPTVRVLIRHYDTCSECGLDRCVKVEKTTIPTEALMKLMGIEFRVPKVM